MVIALEKQNTISLEQFISLPEIKPANEYIDGQIFQKPMPQFQHSTFQSEIISCLNQIGKPKKIAYAFPELRCNFAGISIVPDIAVMRWQNIPYGWVANQVPLAPDWIIEILSPEQSPLRVMNKIGMAMTNGSQLGWLISPAKQLIMVYVGDEFPEQRKGIDTLMVLEDLGDWQPTVNDIFNLLSLE